MVVDCGASLTSTVLVELHHHIGDTMVAAFREAGGLPSIGIDVELYTSGQMFREMQAALLFARGKEVRNNALRGNSPFKTIPVRSREALEWATVNGAKAFQLDGKIGTLSPGKKADIVMLRADDVNMARSLLIRSADEIRGRPVSGYLPTGEPTGARSCRGSVARSRRAPERVVESFIPLGRYAPGGPGFPVQL